MTFLNDLAGWPKAFAGLHPHVYAEQTTVEDAKALFRKYGAVFARAVGAKTVDFTGAEYAASGRGAFGRLGGGRHGKYNAAGVIFKE